MSHQPAEFIEKVMRNMNAVVVGQTTAVERILIALLTGGHVLLEGMPGLAKTLIVNRLARGIDLRFQRVQFTVDLLPTDILGSEVFDPSSGRFNPLLGPINTQLLLADEINRASPKVQSALLEAMQERQVTIGRVTHRLPVPFLVVATQNPIEQSGTFELPEAQLDRFMFCHRIKYPPLSDEEAVVWKNIRLGLKEDESGGALPQSPFDAPDVGPVATLGDLTEAMRRVQEVHVSDVFVKSTVEIMRRTRENQSLEVGCSPRGSIDMVKAARAMAYIRKRDHVRSEDFFELSEDIMLHRMRLTYQASAEGVTARGVLEALLREYLSAEANAGAG
jgi:MoxR-like ATPase